MTNQIYNESQEGLIKSLIANPEYLPEINNFISSDDFVDTKWQLMFDSIKDLDRRNEKITIPGLIETTILNNPDAHLDPAWILSLDNGLTKWVMQGTPRQWAKILKKESTRIKTEKELSNALTKIKNNDPIESINEVTAHIGKIAQDSLTDNENNINELIDYYEKFMEERLDFKKNVIPSPYPSVDKYIVGWLPGQLITIAARTSVGKSVIATQSLLTACEAGKSVKLFSLEMSNEQVLDRMVSSLAMVNLEHMLTKPLTQEEKTRFKEATDSIRQYKLSIDDSPNVTIDYIRNSAIRQAQSPEGLDMIIVDYLQLITNERKGLSRQEIVADISRSMKILAKELQVPVMILAQLNRESKDDPEDRLPQISDIRESAAIAADSDVIILIDRKLEADAIDPKALFIIGKNRNGQVGKKISVRSALEYASFIDDSYESKMQQKDNEIIQSYENVGTEHTQEETNQTYEYIPEVNYSQLDNQVINEDSWNAAPEFGSIEEGDF